MDARPMATHHLARADPGAPHLIATIVVLAIAVMLGAAPASAGTPGDCVVRNGSNGRAYQRLQPAVEAARRGDKLTVRGTCRGSTIVDRKLAIVGVPSQEFGRPILSGTGKGRVLRVEPGIIVRVQDLVVLRGKLLTSRGKPGYGGGIANRGKLTLVDVEVRRNTAGQDGRGGGGGVYNTGTLTLRGSTRISGNFAPDGGGVYNTGTLLMKGASIISANGAESGGGVYNEGTLTMSGSSSIRTNGGEDAGGVTNLGKLTMGGSSVISGNSGGLKGPGGGVYNGRSATLTMNGESAIRGNTSVAAGGGGVANEGGIVRLNDEATINDNTAPCCGGLDTWGKATVTMAESSTIRGNKAESGPGGGVSVRGGTFKMSGTSSISGNTALQSGGGLYPHPRHPHGRQLRPGHLRQRLRQQPQRLLPLAVGPWPSESHSASWRRILQRRRRGNEGEAGDEASQAGPGGHLFPGPAPDTGGRGPGCVPRWHRWWFGQCDPTACRRPSSEMGRRPVRRGAPGS